MISKALKAFSFYHTSRYVLQKEGAEVLFADGVRDHDFKLMAVDFEGQQQMRPGKEKAGAHFILSFHPSEKPSNELMTQLAKEYLERLGVTNTQIVIVKHTDKDHLHMHVIANMVNNEGKTISDSWIGLRGKKIAQQLTREHKLIPALEKDLKLTHVERLNEADGIKYQIYEAVAQNLPLSKSFQDFQDRLSKQGIEVKYKYKGKTDEIQGISFKKGELCFKGSEIDRKFSYSNLKKVLGEQLQEEMSIQLKTPVGRKPAPLSAGPKSTFTRPAPAFQAGGQSQSSGTFLGKLVEEVLTPIDSGGGSVPYELSQEEELRRRKKKKRPSF